MTINQLLVFVLIAESGSPLSVLGDSKDVRDVAKWLVDARLAVDDAPAGIGGPQRYKLTEAGRALIDEFLITPHPQVVQIWKVIR